VSQKTTRSQCERHVPQMASMYIVYVDKLARAKVAKEVPLGRVGEPSDLVAFLCSSPAAYLTGLVVAVDGGRIRSIF
jgi:NAD(P)-dependent dehydrogenase (short-subunit alcohol dehydrogenase family)